MSKSIPPTEDEQIRAIIEMSGHKLQIKVKKWLEENGWQVSSSPHYTDPVTGKLREMDLVAKKVVDLSGGGHGRRGYTMTIQLFIECKYLPKPVVLWFQEKNLEKAIQLAKDNRILQDERNDLCVTGLGHTPPRIHHYVTPNKVAKLSSKQGADDALFEGMNGCLNGLKGLGRHDVEGPYVVNYPVIVVEPITRLVEVTDPEGEQYVPITEPFQWELEHADDERPIMRYHLIDIVPTECLISFLSNLEKCDISIFRDVLSFNLLQEANQRLFEDRSVSEEW